MNRGTVLFGAGCLIFGLLFALGCFFLAVWSEEPKPSNDELPQYSIEQVLQAPEAFEGKLGVYGTGVVVYMDTRTSIAIIVPESFKDFGVKNELRDDQVIPVKMNSVDFKLLIVGSMVKMRGTVEKAEKDGRIIRYIDAESSWATGRVDTTYPNFANLVDVVETEASDDDWTFAWFFVWWFHLGL